MNLSQTTRVGTPFYLAPEIWLNGNYSDKSDIWALGVILYELTHLAKPFTSESIEELEVKVLNEEVKIKEGMDVELKTLIKQILRKDPVKRPSINQIL